MLYYQFKLWYYRLDKLRNKEIHVGDKIKVVKVEDSYKKLLEKTGTVVNTGHFITVNIGGIRYYIEKRRNRGNIN